MATYLTNTAAPPAEVTQALAGVRSVAAANAKRAAGATATPPQSGAGLPRGGQKGLPRGGSMKGSMKALPAANNATKVAVDGPEALDIEAALEVIGPAGASSYFGHVQRDRSLLAAPAITPAAREQLLDATSRSLLEALPPSAIGAEIAEAERTPSRRLFEAHAKLTSQRALWREACRRNAASAFGAETAATAETSGEVRARNRPRPPDLASAPSPRSQCGRCATWPSFSARRSAWRCAWFRSSGRSFRPWRGWRCPPPYDDA